MAKINIKEVIEKIQTSASVKNVYGEPFVVEGRTIIPVARVSYAFGGGGGGGGPVPAPETETGQGETTPMAGGYGEGIGGGMTSTPVGLIEITPAETRFIPFRRWQQIAAAFMGGLLFGLMITGRRKAIVEKSGH